MAESASASISFVNLDPTTYQYSITVTDTGTTPIGTFWFSWVPGQGYLPVIPTFSSPAGWSAQITDGPPPANGYSILWLASTALQPGQSLSGFTFTTTIAPQTLFANSTIHPPTPVTTFTTYSGGIFSDAGFISSATEILPGLTITASTDYRPQTFSNISGITFAGAGAETAIFSASQFGGSGISASATISGDASANQIDIVADQSMFTAALFNFASWTDGADGLVIIGQNVASKLGGSSRNDAIYGGSANDILSGGAGLNQLWGGGGINTASYAGETANLGIDLRAGAAFANGVLRDQMNAIQNIDLGGASATNTVIGDNGANLVTGGTATTIAYGLDGDDTFISGGTYDQFWGGIGSDTVSYAGRAASVYADLRSQNAYIGGTLVGQMNSVENLIGGNASDVLVGDGGANVLQGGAGADHLSGMGGADTFTYAAASDSTLSGGYDTIADFQTGLDKLDLTSLGLSAAQIVIQTDASSTSLYAVTAGSFNPATDLAISFAGANAIAQSDVLL
jgi:Ca2+-binding RTX toxin-like protein